MGGPGCACITRPPPAPPTHPPPLAASATIFGHRPCVHPSLHALLLCGKAYPPCCSRAPEPCAAPALPTDVHPPRETRSPQTPSAPATGCAGPSEPTAWGGPPGRAGCRSCRRRLKEGGELHSAGAGVQVSARAPCHRQHTHTYRFHAARLACWRLYSIWANRARPMAPARNPSPRSAPSPAAHACTSVLQSSTRRGRFGPWPDPSMQPPRASSPFPPQPRYESRPSSPPTPIQRTPHVRCMRTHIRT